MELVKQHESYRMTKTFDNEWKAEGSVNCEESGSVSMWCSISTSDTHIGNFNYSKPQSGNINVNYDVSEENREEFTKCTDLLISELATKLSE